MKNRTTIIIIFALWTIFMILGTDGKIKRDKPCNRNANMTEPRKLSCDCLAFLAAAQRGRVEEIRTLLNKSYVNYLLGYKEKTGWRSGYTALIYAAENNNTELVQMLVEAGATANHISDNGYTAVFYMASHGNEGSLRLLIQNGSLVNVTTQTGLTPLLMASWNGHPVVVKILLQHDADPNIVTRSSGYFPLYFAAKLGDGAMLKALLDSSATVNFQTTRGVTALLTAAAWGHEQAVITLLDNKADPNILDIYNSGPLHRAASYGYTNILRKLIEAKADVNAQDTDGKTPLHIVAGRGQASTLQELLKHCPVNTILDNDGEDALDSAKVEKERLLRKRASRSKGKMLQNIERVISILNDYSGC